MKWRAYRPALTGSLEEPLERNDQLQAIAAEWFEAVVPVERRRTFILGVHDQGEDGCLGTRRANGCVSQQGASELLALERLVDGQATDARNGHTGVAGQPFGQRSWQIVQWHASGRERVVARHLAGSDFAGDVASADAPLDVLAGLAGQVAVQRWGAARKRLSVMTWAERLQAERRGHLAPAIRRWRALSARFIAGASGGGLSSRSAKRC